MTGRRWRAVTGSGSLRSAQIKPAIRALQTVDRGIAREWRQHAKKELAVPWARELASHAPAGQRGAAAARSIGAGVGQLPAIWAGRGEWKPGFQPFFSLEFGRDHNKFSTYVRTSPRGVRHFVRRRTGTWAPQHRGRAGWWFFPAMSRSSDRYTEKVATMLADFLEGSL
jgi:hypothetical protein